LKLPTYFISHGGGPWPWTPDWRKRFANLEASLAHISAELGEAPKAVLVVSGHWEEAEFTVMTAERPSMIYDYYGFPPETYKIIYSAPGAPDVADRTAALISAAQIPVRRDETRGFDHGAFTPLFIIYPDADVPVYQLSLKAGYDPALHMALGRAIAPLRDDGVLIIGSGLSYHNLGLFGPGAKEPSEAFDIWLNDQLTGLSGAARSRAIGAWEKAPFARLCHPREDHLAPLFVALGAAEDETATRTYHDTGLFGGVTASSYRFG